MQTITVADREDIMNKFLLSFMLLLTAFYPGWLAELHADNMAAKEAANLCQQQTAPAESKREVL